MTLTVNTNYKLTALLSTCEKSLKSLLESGRVMYHYLNSTQHLSQAVMVQMYISFHNYTVLRTLLLFFKNSIKSSEPIFFFQLNHI